MPPETNCCGFNLDFKKITFLGIFTFSFPLLLLSSLIFLILTPFSKFIPAINILQNNLGLLIRINFRLINSICNLKIRCMLSGKIFSYSPMLAGIIYKYLNTAFLLSLWIIVILIFRLILKL